MQVPERLALIGGSILLSSLLIFSLKGQASQIIPNVSHSIENVYQNITDTQAQHGALSFDGAFKNAQGHGWQTGNWGSAKFYVDSQGGMHVGSGELNNSYTSVVNPDNINSINLDKNVQAPSDSDNLFSRAFTDNNSLHAINGLYHLDTSHTFRMANMFNQDKSLTNLDVSHFDTSHVWNMANMFDRISSVRTLDLSNLDTSHLGWELAGTLAGNDFQQIKLGDKAKITNSALDGTYKNTDTGQVLNSSHLTDNNAHPGTWVRQ